MSTDLLRAVRDLEPRVRQLADEAETQRRLPVELAEEFGRLGLWRAAVPAAVGGSEVPLRELLEIFEELARADGSVGWCAMIGATGAIAYSSLAADTAAAMMAEHPDACTGGVFAPLGRAVEVEEGFLVDGRWAFGSGVEHSTRMIMGTLVWEGDGPKIGPDGMPQALWFLLEPGEFSIVDTWTVSGLRGTGSHDVVVEGVVVPRERSCVLGTSDHAGPLYVFPLFPLLAVSVAAVPLGIARSAIDELMALASVKTATGQRRRLADRTHVQMQVALAEAELRAARAFLYSAVDEAWERAEAGVRASPEERAVIRLAATNAAWACARVVDRMYETGGGTSIYATSRLQRDFRDVHTATQHAVVNQATLELAGGVLLGAEMDISRL